MVRNHQRLKEVGRCVQVTKTYKATQQLMATTIILEMEGTMDQTLHLAATSWFCEKSYTLSSLHMHGMKFTKSYYQATLASYSSLVVRLFHKSRY